MYGIFVAADATLPRMHVHFAHVWLWHHQTEGFAAIGCNHPDKVCKATLCRKQSMAWAA
jgi:hypothetical protein